MAGEGRTARQRALESGDYFSSLLGRLIALDSTDPRRAWREFERSRGHCDLPEEQLDALCAVTDAEIDTLFR